MTTIQPNTVITAVSICDSNCVFKAEVLSRKGDFVTVKVMGEIVRKKVNLKIFQPFLKFNDMN